MTTQPTPYRIGRMIHTATRRYLVSDYDEWLRDAIFAVEDWQSDNLCIVLYPQDRPDQEAE